MKLSHINDKGESKMVDISSKKQSQRIAIAIGIIKVSKGTLSLIKNDEISKGNVFEVARVAGIMACKKTPELIPMCHTLNIEGIDIKFNTIESDNMIQIIAKVKSFGKTGVEMEALTAVNITALTIYDMCKAVDKNMEISDIKLTNKIGGKSGEYVSLDLQGEIVDICISTEKGTPKEKIDEGILIENHGLKDDAHAGKWHRQISLLAKEEIETMRNEGLKLKNGAFGENIITSGIKLNHIPVGSVIEIGESLLEVTQIGKECHDKCEIFHQVGKCIMPNRGIFAKVIKGGKIYKEDRIQVIYNV